MRAEGSVQLPRTMWFILSDSYSHTHTQHNAGRQQLGACLLVNYSTTSSINLQAKVLKVNQPKRSFDRLRNSPNIVSSELYASNV